jgi:PmbA protein
VLLSVRTIKDKRIGYASSNRLDGESVRRTVGTAVTIARQRPQDPDFKSLPESGGSASIDSYDSATADLSPAARAKAVNTVVEKAAESKLSAAGAFSNEAAILGVANSLGIKSIQPLTQASFSTVISSPSSSGFASFVSRKAGDMRVEELAGKAMGKALNSEDPASIEPGRYTAILEEEAVAQLVSFLGFIGFGALAFQEQRSFLHGKLGQKIVGENITLWDDALDRRTIGFPFDFEGVPKRKVILIEQGVAKNIVYDSYTAQRENKESTGHALPAPNPYGPIPVNLFLGPGDSSTDEMIASTERGILVTRFHYTNIEDPMKTTLTGMTRDGTFLIKDGKIAGGIRNLRITQGILEALNNVELISKTIRLVDGGFGACCVPMLKIKDFNFTGVTEF